MKIATPALNSTTFRRLTMTATAAVVLLLAAATVRAEIALSNRVVTTPRHVFTLDNSGLPAQVEIRAVSSDIPLAWRAEKVWPPALLRRIGRGEQLVTPVRLEAVIDKVTVVAKADAPAELRKTDKGVEAIATWQAEKLKGRLSLLYSEDGSLTGQITFSPEGTDLERLELVLEISGPVDTAIAGNPAETVAGKPLPVDYGSLDPNPDMLWLNGSNPVGDGGAHKGRVPHFFLGNGDRGFTWLAHGEEGFAIRDKEPSMSVERTRAGTTVWRIALVNNAPGGGEKTAGFTLLTHPARARAAAGRRLQQWQPWSEKAAVPALAAAALGSLSGTNILVRADAGSVFETAAARALLEGPAGGDALSTAATLADRFPIGLFRYLAAPHTALAVQLRPNAAALTSPSASPALDRMALGRALLHDIGVDLGGLADRVGAADVVRALEGFGYFESDGQSEFLPYWRTEGIFQFGEDFEADAGRGFAVTSESPTARTKVSAFIRSAGVENTAYTGAKNRRKTIFVLVNEGTKAVREYLIIQNPQYLFGGPNKIQVEHIYSQLDFSYLAPDGDWNRCRVESSDPGIYSRGTMKRGNTSGNRRSGGGFSTKDPPTELMDLETGGYVRMGDKEIKIRGKFAGDMFLKNGWQLYGPVYVPPRGMRLLYGAGSMVLPQGIAGRVFDRKTGKPLSVPVHVFSGKFKESETPAADKDRRLLVTVQADKDGRFRCPGISGGTVVAEVAGKMVPAQPQREMRINKLGEKWESDDTCVDLQTGVRYWPNFEIRAIYEDNLFGSAGKWLDVLIEADAPPAP